MVKLNTPFLFLEADNHEEEINCCTPLTICDAAENDIANVYSDADATVTVTREQAVATAHLFAAAPELLEAAKAYVSQIDLFGLPDDETTSKMRAAIAKAEGRL